MGREHVSVTPLQERINENLMLWKEGGVGGLEEVKRTLIEEGRIKTILLVVTEKSLENCPEIKHVGIRGAGLVTITILPKSKSLPQEFHSRITLGYWTHEPPGFIILNRNGDKGIKYFLPQEVVGVELTE